MNEREKQQRIHRNRKRKKRNLTKLRSGKLIFIGFIFVLCFMGLLVRVVYLKYKFGGDFERRAMRQQIAGGSTDYVGVINPIRGSIYDRNKQALANSIVVYKAILDIRKLLLREEKEINTCLQTLNELLGIPMEQLKEITAADALGNPINDTQYYILAKGVSQKLATELKEKKLPDLWFEEDSRRVYLHKSLASSVIGFIRGGEAAYGLESRYNEYLTGEPGRSFRTFDGEKNVVSQQIPAKDGYSLITNLDLVMQQYAEDAVLQAGLEYNPENAFALIMNPKTAEIYAMAQYPAVDSNNPSDLAGLSSERLRQELTDLPQREQLDKLIPLWANYGVTSTFEPGSIFKPVVVAAALEENIIKPDDIFDCAGTINVRGSNIPCFNNTVHGRQNLTQVLANSCNVAMIKISEKLGRDLFFKYRTDFGFGEKTDIDLPAEADVSDPRVMYTLSQLNPVELATSSMGQGSNTTAIQAINAFSAVINGGNLMKPFLVSQIVDRQGNLVKEFLPTIQKKVISQETSDFLRKALQSVVTPTGTGHKAYIEGYSIGGKTGTGQQGRGENEKVTVSFIAYLPVEDPEIIAMMLINKPEEDIQGSTSAAPLLKEILQKLINYKAIKPSAGESTENLSLEKGSFLLKDYRGVSILETIKELNTQKLDFEIIGHGSIVTETLPTAGAAVSPGTKVFINISEGSGGASLVQTPSVLQMRPEEAVELIKQAGFIPIIVEDPVATPSPSGSPAPTASAKPSSSSSPSPSPATEKRVYEQMPGPEIKIQPGVEIKLKVR